MWQPFPDSSLRPPTARARWWTWSRICPERWFTPYKALKMATYDNAQLLKLCGPRDPYPGKLGVIEEGALADLLLVNANPLEDLDLVADPDAYFAMIMKDGKIYKNLVE